MKYKNSIFYELGWLILDTFNMKGLTNNPRKLVSIVENGILFVKFTKVIN
jgi:hypothetical protein